MNFVTIIKPLANGRGNEEIIITSPGSLDDIPPLRDFEDTQILGGVSLRFGGAFANPGKVPRNRASVDIDKVVMVIALSLLAFVGVAGWLK